MANNRAIGIRKSQFNAKVTVPATATLDFVDGVNNFKITFADFITALGTTTTTVQVGDPLDTPVLDIQGTINGIRNIADGFGITTSINAQNSLEITTSFTFDTTGAELVDDPTAPAPAFRSLVAGTAVTLDEATGTITINVDETGLTPANRVIVNVKSDFPTPVAGVITGVSNTQYFVGANVSLGADRLDLSAGNVSVTGIDFINSGLTYTGTGDMFTIVNTRSRISGMTLTATTGRVFNYSDNTGGGFIMHDCLLVCDRIGIATSTGPIGSVVRFTTVSPANVTTDGLEFVGNFRGLIWEVSQAFVVAGSLFDFGTAVFDNIEIDLTAATISAGANFIKGLTASGNISATGIGLVTRNTITGVGTPLSGLSSDDSRYKFVDNDGIADTQPDALASLTSNAVNTVIAATDTPVLVAGTWVSEQASLYTISAAGRITYTGVKLLATPIDIVVDIEPASGTNKLLTTYVALNGTVVASSGRQIQVNTGNPLNVTVIWQFTLTENDFIEVFVENNSDTIDILVSGAVSRAR